MAAVKTFKFDRVVRNSDGIGVGRAVLDDLHPYEEGMPLHLVMLTVYPALVPNPLSYEFYVDGVSYRIPETFESSIRMMTGGGVFRINTVVLHPSANGS